MDAQLIISEPAVGVWNMAVDEVLLAQAADSGRSSLRFYRWEPATLSLGYFQRVQDRALHSGSATLPLVRRASGGGAIVHDREMTYAFACPSDDMPGGSERLYDVFHQTLVDTLRAIADVPAEICTKSNDNHKAFLCFQRHSLGDVLCGDHKIAGSAQRRRRGAILQHGSVLLEASPAAPELLGIAQLAGEVSRDAILEAWLERITQSLRLSVSVTDLEQEQVELAKIERDRLAKEPWWNRR